MLQFVEHVQFPAGKVAAGVNPGEQAVELADLLGRQEDYALLLKRPAGPDRACGTATGPRRRKAARPTPGR